MKLNYKLLIFIALVLYLTTSTLYSLKYIGDYAPSDYILESNGMNT